MKWYYWTLITLAVSTQLLVLSARAEFVHECEGEQLPAPFHMDLRLDYTLSDGIHVSEFVEGLSPPETANKSTSGQ